MDKNQSKKILQDYYFDLSERRLKLLEKNTEWASAIEERSLTFSQFLFSVGAGLLAIFFSVKDFNNLIVNHNIFNWAVVFYLFSFLLFILSFKEKLDADSAGLVKSSKQSEADFSAAYSVLEKQFSNGVDINIFYNEIQDLVEENQKKKIESEKGSQKIADYSLELYVSLSLISFWFLFFSTQNWCIFYLYIGIMSILYLSNSQNRYFYRLIRSYSKFMSKIFPTKDM